MITLLILDGYGERKESEGNAILGNSPKIELLKKNYPSCLLDASGQEVGLVKGQMGNSETDDGIIEDAKFKTFGCAAAISSTSVATELIKGKTIEDALNVKNSEIIQILGGLPAQKIHCSILAEEAIRAAVDDYYKRKEKENKKN